MDVFDLAATLSLDTSQYESGLAGASQSAQGFGGVAGKVASGVKTGFKVAATAVGALTAAGTAITGVFVGAANKTAEYGDQVDKMSQKLGLSSDAYQKWGYVINLAGADINSMTAGLKTLTNQVDNAKNGSADAQERFAKLGISMDELGKMSREEVFEAAISGFQKMEDSTERAALANDLFGKSGQNLTPLFNQSVKQTQEQLEMAEKYGMVMPEAAVKASAAFEDSLTTMDMTFTGLKNRMMGEFLPSMTQVTDGMAKLFAGDMSGADDVAKGIEGIIDKMGEVLPVLVDIGGRIIGHLAKGFIKNLPHLIQTTWKGLLAVGAKIMEWITKIPGMLGSTDIAGGFDQAIQGLFDALPKIWDGIAEFIDGLANWLVANAPRMIISMAKGIIRALPSVISAMGKITNAILRVVVGIPVKLLAMGLSVVGKFALGLLKGANKAATNMGKVVKRVLSAVSKLPSNLLSAAGKAVRSFAKGISNGASNAVTAAGNFIKKVYNKIKDKVGDFTDIGKNIVKGVQNGFSNIWKDFTKWLGKKFKGLPKPVRQALGISSPSRVFAREIGQWIPKGIAKGIEDNEAAIEDALDDVMDDAMPDVGDYMFSTAGSGHGVTNKYMNFNYSTVVDGATDPEEWGRRSMREIEREMRSQ